MKLSGLLRAGWNLLDQVISSGTNALLSFLIARSVSASDFGGFSVAFTIFSVFIGVSRALGTSPLSVRFAGKDAEQFRRGTAAGVGTALGIGLLGGAMCLIAGVLVGGPAGTALLALGVVLPGLLVQDAWRFVFFAEGRPSAAAVNDAAWAVLQVGAVGALVVSEVDAIAPLTLAWGLSACAAAVLGLRQTGVRPLPSQARAWLRTHANLTRYLLLEYVTLQGAQQLSLLCIASIGSLSAIGALRGAVVLLGPATILAVSMYSFALPEFSRQRHSLSAKGWMSGAFILSFFVTALVMLWGVIFLFVPDTLGEELLGETWTSTRAILVASLVQQVGTVIAIGPATMLYAMDRAKVTLAIHAALAPMMLAGGVIGVIVGGAEGAAWGFAVAFWSVVPAWWIKVYHEAKAIALRRPPDLLN